MTTPHYLLCKEPICQGDPNPKYKKEVVWRPGELICKKKPYEKFQLVQLRINQAVEEGKFKEMDRPFNVIELEASLY